MADPNKLAQELALRNQYFASLGGQPPPSVEPLDPPGVTGADEAKSAKHLSALGSMREAISRGIEKATKALLPDESNVQDPNMRSALEEVFPMRGKERPEGGDLKDVGMHAQFFQDKARQLKPFLGPATGPALEVAGLANEVADRFTGGVSDPTDLVANRIGIQKGLEEGAVSPVLAAVRGLLARR